MYVNMFTLTINAMLLGRVALNKAEVLLKMNNGLTRLENIWGVGDGSQSYLSNQVLISLDVQVIGNKFSVAQSSCH
jgi:hypothetical protein